MPVLLCIIAWSDRESWAAIPDQRLSDITYSKRIPFWCKSCAGVHVPFLGWCPSGGLCGSLATAVLLCHVSLSPSLLCLLSFFGLLLPLSLFLRLSYGYSWQQHVPWKWMVFFASERCLRRCPSIPRPKNAENSPKSPELGNPPSFHNSRRRRFRGSSRQHWCENRKPRGGKQILDGKKKESWIFRIWYIRRQVHAGRLMCSRKNCRDSVKRWGTLKSHTCAMHDHTLYNVCLDRRTTSPVSKMKTGVLVATRLKYQQEVPVMTNRGLILLWLFIFGCVAVEIVSKDEDLLADPVTGPIVAHLSGKVGVAQVVWTTDVGCWLSVIDWCGKAHVSPSAMSAQTSYSCIDQ